MAGDVALTPVFLNPEATSIINDNYLSCPTLSTKVLHSLDKRLVQKTFQAVEPKVVDSSVLNVPKTQKATSLNPQSASYLAVSHVHSVCFHKRKVLVPLFQR